MDEKLYQLNVTLSEIEPPVWRRLIVSASISLKRLHRVLQAAMGWQDYHLYAFEADGARYGEPDSEDPEDFTVPSARVKLSSLLRSGGDKLLYVYDLGDDWRHEVLLEDLPAASEYKTYPVCLDGERACPPEDSGGPYSYMEWLERLTGKDEADRREARGILGRRFDPQKFDLKSVNRRLKSVAGLRR